MALDKKNREVYERIRSFMLTGAKNMDWRQAIEFYEELSTDIEGNIDALKAENEEED